tara:strand:+ start:373 stop:981 length:609 start_codon:yes stop_codon:yes gene_type:complete
MIKTSLLLLWRQKSEMLTGLAFLLLAWFFIGILSIQDSFSVLQYQYIFWLVFLFSASFSSVHAFKDDFEDGTLALLKTESGSVLDLFIFSRLILLLFINTLNSLVSFCCLSLFIESFLWELALKVLLVLPGVISLFLMAQALCLSHKNTSQMFLLIVWPLAVPFFLFATASSQEGSFVFLVSLSTFLSPLCFWGTRFILRFV